MDTSLEVVFMESMEGLKVSKGSMEGLEELRYLKQELKVLTPKRTNVRLLASLGVLFKGIFKVGLKAIFKVTLAVP